MSGQRERERESIFVHAKNVKKSCQLVPFSRAENFAAEKEYYFVDV